MNKIKMISTQVRLVVTALLMTTYCCAVTAQTRFIDRGGYASFFSSAPMEDIKAESKQVVSILDIREGKIVASMLMRSFNFRKALMQEHFNENYVESHKYPKASFTGSLRNIDQVDLARDGMYTLDVTGEITLHGVTKPLALKAEVVVSGGAIQANAVFPLRVKDFEIQVPRLVMDNIAEVVEVTVSFNYKPM